MLSRRTVERWRINPAGDRRRGPKTRPANKLSEEERQTVIAVCCSKEFVDKCPRQIVPILADRGTYIASEATFYRILKAKKLLEYRGPARSPTHQRPEELIANAPNQIWSWDITYLRTSVLGMFYYLYMAIDIYSRKIVAWDVAEYEGAGVASRMIRRACLIEGVQRHQLFIHSDNGGPMKAATMLATLRHLGVMPSFSRPNVSDDNAFSEALFKTLKYRPWYPDKPFVSVQAAKEWVKTFVEWYNREHLHSGINYVTPSDRHEGKNIFILEKRRAIYEFAKKQNPKRWTTKAKQWVNVESVALNSLKSSEIHFIKK
jgi:transposase InsO family protein